MELEFNKIIRVIPILLKRVLEWFENFAKNTRKFLSSYQNFSFA